MKVKVKICGIRSLESAQAAIDAHADFLGFNFIKESKRYIYPIRAKAIIDQVRSKNHESRIKVIGVFQNQTIDEVNNITDFLGLDYVQLHGEENMEYVSKIKTKVIKAIVIPTEGRVEAPPRSGKSLYGRSHTTELQEMHSGMSFVDFVRNDKVKYFLLDRQVQGKGSMVNMQKAKEIAKIYSMFFAGRLTPDNVTKIVKEVQPFAVDVASGIETNGKEDPAKIRLFIQRAKSENSKGVTI